MLGFRLNRQGIGLRNPLAYIYGYLLQENGDYVLQEDGSRILVFGTPPPYLIQENNDYLLQEDGTRIIA